MPLSVIVFFLSFEGQYLYDVFLSTEIVAICIEFMFYEVPTVEGDMCRMHDCLISNHVNLSTTYQACLGLNKLAKVLYLLNHHILDNFR